MRILYFITEDIPQRRFFEWIRKRCDKIEALAFSLRFTPEEKADVMDEMLSALISNYKAVPLSRFEPLESDPCEGFDKILAPSKRPAEFDQRMRATVKNPERIDIICEEEVSGYPYDPSLIDLFYKYDLEPVRSLKRNTGDVRTLHAISVAKTAYLLASELNLDPIKAFEAGLFHDCGKGMGKEESRKILREMNLNPDEIPPFAYHQFTGAYLAKNRYGIEDEEILSSIASHCTGKPDMNALDKVIYAADKIEPTRSYPTADLLKRCEDDFNSGFISVLKEQREYLKRNSLEPSSCPLTRAMYRENGLMEDKTC